MYAFSGDVVKRVASEIIQKSSQEGEDVLAGRWMYQLGLRPMAWRNATADEFYESMLSSSGQIGTPAGWWKRAEYTNATIGIHLLKTSHALLHAYAHFLPLFPKQPNVTC